MQRGSALRLSVRLRLYVCVCKGSKTNAILSEVASTGDEKDKVVPLQGLIFAFDVSLQANKTKQQFGRVHRSNSASK